MNLEHIPVTESISYPVWSNLRDKFDSQFTQYELKQFYKLSLPVFVRSNNRNIYGSIFIFNGCYVVGNYFRLKRDGTPVRLYLES